MMWLRLDLLTRGNLHSTVDKPSSLREAVSFSKSMYDARLDIHRVKLRVEVLGQDCELDCAAPRFGRDHLGRIGRGIHA